jgi:hypothetical protein
MSSFQKKKQILTLRIKYLSKQRYNVRNRYEGPTYSLKTEGKKVQQLIDDYIRSGPISELVNPREVTYKACRSILP